MLFLRPRSFTYRNPRPNPGGESRPCYWILFGVLCFALAVTVFVYGVRIGKI